MPKADETLPQSAFWQRVLEAALDKQWPDSQNALAKKLGRSQGSVQAWVRGQSLPAIKGAIQIAGKLGVCVEWLLTGDGPKKAKPDDPELLELVEIWSSLAPDRQSATLKFVRFQQSEQQATAPPHYPKQQPFHAPTNVHDRPRRLRSRK